MAAGRLRPRALPAGPARLEWAARLLALLFFAGLPLAVIVAARPDDGVVTLRATMPEDGGWQPGHLAARAGEPLALRLTSDDVVHGFAVGVGPDGRRPDERETLVLPGQVTPLTLTFPMPGTYTYYCTRWCGPNHWRMRGTITVGGAELPTAGPPEPPLYARLGLDIDAPHPAAVVPAAPPSAARGRALAVAYPPALLARDAYLTQSPVQVWQALRAAPDLSGLDDGALWDAVAALWGRNTGEEQLTLGAALYAQNCAACHGETGAGDGVFAQAGVAAAPGHDGHGFQPATDFTDPALLGAGNALLGGKILRGGMGTGMPAWGTVLTAAEIQALLDYLWTFPFPPEAG